MNLTLNLAVINESFNEGCYWVSSGLGHVRERSCGGASAEFTWQHPLAARKKFMGILLSHQPRFSFSASFRCKTRVFTTI